MTPTQYVQNRNQGSIPAACDTALPQRPATEFPFDPSVPLRMVKQQEIDYKKIAFILEGLSSLERTDLVQIVLDHLPRL